MSGSVISQHSGVESFPTPARSTAVSDELCRILDLLWGEFPHAKDISFTFDGKLLVQIDVRSIEDIAVVEAKLPGLGGGLFSHVRHGSTPGRAFAHRISAFVAR